MVKQSRTLIESLEHWSLQKPDHQALVYIQENEIVDQLTYSELRFKARRLAVELTTIGARGDRALLVFDAGLDFLVAFYACQYAGLIAVPCCMPRAGSKLQPIHSITKSCEPSLILTTSKSQSLVSGSLQRLDDFTRPRVVEVDTLILSQVVDASGLVDPTPDDIAFLQYTSGSTSHPKGVVLRHRNIIANQKMIQESFNHSGDIVVVGWLPTYHDMGLIGNVIQPLWLGGTSVLMSPIEFYFHPVRWLQAISRFKATTAGSPPWGYKWCADRVSSSSIDELDLSAWNVAYVGAEPISVNILNEFSQKFLLAGFDHSSFLPCYGLAEATLFVTGVQSKSPIDVIEIENRSRVNVGYPRNGTEIKIVDPANQAELPMGVIGEIVVRGPSVGSYWNLSDQTSDTFNLTVSGQSGFLRTGDLGCVDENRLFITGRLKDILIKNGKKYHAEDIEVTVRECCGLGATDMVAVFSIDEKSGEDVVVAYEVSNRKKREGQLDELLVKAIRSQIRKEHGLDLSDVIEVCRGGIPRTSSGKVRRSTCRELFLTGKLA